MFTNRWVMMGSWLLLSLQLLLTLLLWSNRQPQLVLFDMKATVQLFSKQLASSHLSEAQQQALSAQFSKTLEKVIAEYSRDHHVILMNPATVVTPLPDVTEAIQDAVAVRLQTSRGDRVKK